MLLEIIEDKVYAGDFTHSGHLSFRVVLLDPVDGSMLLTSLPFASHNIAERVKERIEKVAEHTPKTLDRRWTHE